MTIVKWVLHEESSQWTQWTWGAYQDGGYYSRNEHRCFPKSLSISIFQQIWQVRTCNKYSFWPWELSFNKAPNLSNMVLTTLGSSIEGFQQVWQFLIFHQIWQVCTCSNFQLLIRKLWMVSQRIVDFPFFVKLDRSANAAREQFFDVYFFNHFEPLITTKLHWCKVACAQTHCSLIQRQVCYSLC